MKLFIGLITVTLLSGCSLLEPVVEQGAQVNDAALQSAEFTICNAASIGSIKRKYDTPEKAELWRKFCMEEQGFSLSDDGNGGR